MNKEKIIGPFIALIVVIFILLVMSYRKSYPTLKEAVRATSRGGEVEDKISCNGGEFVFIKNSNVITSGYYYKENKKWYYDSTTRKKDYQIEDNILVSVYYLQEQDFSIIEVITDKDINVSDIDNNKFTKKKEKEHEYIGSVNKQIGSNYKIIIDEKEYTIE